MKYIYIAGPYTNGDPVLNVRKAIKAADELRELGYVPFILTFATSGISSVRMSTNIGCCTISSSSRDATRYYDSPVKARALTGR